MLKVQLVSDYKNLDNKVIKDVHYWFCESYVKYSELDRLIVRTIDKGELAKDTTTFIDRFGRGLFIDYLSTGSKAALLVVNSGQPVSMMEVGNNARDFILTQINTGEIVLEYNGIGLSCDFDIPVDVEINGTRLKTSGEIQNYLEGKPIYLGELRK